MKTAITTSGRIGKRIGKLMKKKTNVNRKYKFTYIKTTVLTIFCCTLFLNGHTPFEKTGDNYFHIMLNGQAVGTRGDRERAEELLVEARRGIASESDELLFLETDLQISGEEVLWGKVDRESDVLDNMDAVLRSNVQETMHRSYTLKVNEYMVNLASMDEVRQLLQAAIDKYDSENKFQVELVYDQGREFSVLTSNVVDTSLDLNDSMDSHLEAGIQPVLSSMGATRVTEEGEKDFGDYDLGILSMECHHLRRKVPRASGCGHDLRRRGAVRPEQPDEHLLRRDPRGHPGGKLYRLL